MKPIVVIPTFNEKENMKPLISGILAQDERLHVVIADDYSPDGTGELIKEMMKTNDRLHLVQQPPQGGRAYADRAGMRYGLDHGFDVILQMDADQSHDPKYLPAMLEAVSTHDIAIGSRLIPGGGIENRSWVRDVITTLANFYIHCVLGMWDVKDCTTGYRAYKREVLEAIDIDQTFSPGPSLLEEILYKAHKKGFTKKEIPIVFKDRTHGESKLTLKELLDIFRLVLKIRFSA